MGLNFTSTRNYGARGLLQPVQKGRSNVSNLQPVVEVSYFTVVTVQHAVKGAIPREMLDQDGEQSASGVLAKTLCQSALLGDGWERIKRTMKRNTWDS
jgi:hypothetical protein